VCPVPAVLPRLAPLRVVLAVPFRATAAPEDGEVAVRVVWPVPEGAPGGCVRPLRSARVRAAHPVLADGLTGTVKVMAPEADNTTTSDAPATTDAPASTSTSTPDPAPATDTTGGTTTDAPATDAPLSGPHEQAAGVETDPDVLAAPPADED
jgi:hypothetical protein